MWKILIMQQPARPGKCLFRKIQLKNRNRKTRELVVQQFLFSAKLSKSARCRAPRLIDLELFCALLVALFLNDLLKGIWRDLLCMEGAKEQGLNIGRTSLFIFLSSYLNIF